MLTEQRYQIILDLLKEKKSVTATELKEILDTSESTVRRDITAVVTDIAEAYVIPKTYDESSIELVINVD